MRNGYNILYFIFCIFVLLRISVTCSTLLPTWLNFESMLNAYNIYKQVYMCVSARRYVCRAIYNLKFSFFISLSNLINKFRSLKCYCWKFGILTSYTEGHDFETRHVGRSFFTKVICLFSCPLFQEKSCPSALTF